MTDHLSKEFWSNRYATNTTGWDLGLVSPPIKAYFDQIENKDLKILIPGCGFGHEAEYLFKQGFKNVHIADITSEPLEDFSKRVPEFPDSQIHQVDFFAIEDVFDVIVEQTLFCAIDPKLRSKYAQAVSRILKEDGILIGLLFNKEFESGPPYGGKKEEYVETFQPYFRKISMEPCYNSIEPRQGGELFIKIQKD